MVAFRPSGNASRMRRPTNKRHWTPEEDELLITLVETYGAAKWEKLATHIQGRSGRSCRTRWLNQLSPGLNRSSFSAEEKQKLIALHEEFGNKWSFIVSFFPGRTDNQVKNEYHMHVKTRTMKKVVSSTQNDPHGSQFSDLATGSAPMCRPLFVGRSSSVCGRDEGSTQIGAPSSTCHGPHPHRQISSENSMISDATTVGIHGMQFIDFLGVEGLDEK